MKRKFALLMCACACLTACSSGGSSHHKAADYAYNYETHWLPIPLRNAFRTILTKTAFVRRAPFLSFKRTI